MTGATPDRSASAEDASSEVSADVSVAIPADTSGDNMTGDDGSVELPPGRRIPAWVMGSRLMRAVGPHVFPRMHRYFLRRSGGKSLGNRTSQPMLVLTTTGVKSGLPRTTPLAAIPRTQGRYLIVGSNFARESHPAWTANLLAEPRATIIVDGSTFEVTARLLSGEERERCWQDSLRWYPGWARYREVSDREFRMFELVPTT